MLDCFDSLQPVGMTLMLIGCLVEDVSCLDLC